MIIKNILKMLLKYFALLASVWGPVAHAGEQAGKVKSLHVREGGLIYVVLEGVRSNPPACATADYWMVKSEASQAGRQQYVLLVSARLTGSRVAIRGAGACTRWSDGEDIYEVTLVD
jgi:hypothetical protein